MAEEKNTQVKLIKKYKNRRLYDLDRSQYITVEDLQSYVMEDIDFQVIDVVSGKDLTNATLLQIFVELEAHSTEALSSKVLCQLIRLSQHPMSQHYKQILEQMLTQMQSQTNPYLQTAQEASDMWIKQSEKMMHTWQEWMRKHHE